MTRLLIIGLDGGSFDLIRPWVNQGKLPNFKRLLEGSVWGELQSTVPPMTFPGWSALMTGKNPGKHGIFDFTQRRLGTYEIQILNVADRKAKTFWRLLSDAGKRVASIGVPVTYPPEPVNGVMISGFDAPANDSSIMYPPALYEELKKNVGEYILSADFVRLLVRGRLDKAVDALCEAVERKGATASYLLKRESWDCFMLVFGETDAVVHYFWKHHDPHSPHHDPKHGDQVPDPILRIYQKVDQCLGELLSHLSEETRVMLVSDHGVGGSSDKIIHLNRWLEARGLLHYRSLADGSGGSLQMKVLHTLKSWIRAVFPKRIIKRLRFQQEGIGIKMEAKLRFGAIDWSRTTAYSEETPYYPNIWINLKGRDPGGIVEMGEEYEKVREQVKSLILEWRDPETGQPVVKQAFRREEIYRGEYVHLAPDLVIAWNLDGDYAYLSRPSYASKSRLPIEKVKKRELSRSAFMVNRSGSHREMGVFALNGEGLRPGYQSMGAEIIDVAPTVLYLMGLAVPKDMDGKVLLDCFLPQYLEKHPVSYHEAEWKAPENAHYAYTEDEEAKISDKLKALGYLE